jgi:hypothetical protein
VSTEAAVHAPQPIGRAQSAPLSAPLGIRALFGILIAIGALTFLSEVRSDPTRAYASWLQNYWFFLSLGLAGAFFTAIHHLVGATWSVVVRRVAESFTAFLPVAFLLLLVVYVGVPHIYVWSTSAGAHAREGVDIAKGGYLAGRPFMIRNLVFLALWTMFAWIFVRNSTRQDATREVGLSRASLKLSPAFLLLFALTFTLASFDMLMSLEPTWYSTIFGVYCWAGLWQSGLSAIAIVAILLRRQGALRGILNRPHLHDLGKYMFAFSVFWTYIAFSQLMLIWYANLPEEIEWMIHRIYSGWGAVAILVGILKFGVPFFVLMPQKWKENESVLLGVGAGILLGQWLDIYWIILPAFSPKTVVLGWSEIGTALGFLGLFGWCVLSFLSRYPVAAHGDPVYEQSVRFHG